MLWTGTSPKDSCVEGLVSRAAVFRGRTFWKSLDHEVSTSVDQSLDGFIINRVDSWGWWRLQDHLAGGSTWLGRTLEGKSCSWTLPCSLSLFPRYHEVSSSAELPAMMFCLIGVKCQWIKSSETESKWTSPPLFSSGILSQEWTSYKTTRSQRLSSIFFS